ncbi:recombinase family protein [Metabacillus malikii]|uniref:DNA invertase Pin-like site-specific DNA recombinase n=1 Tax=Metabacillus malikii TaxID=1504265 RepID=A0ABT9ZM06_9BACI|nr:recombinase family protein [Metabacillus malikii]MDQ0233025.1 DNA invertase Pin-like site-specific DNA recombinase [Metabacillus malikii]
MLFGYCRVSTTGQNLATQRKLLRQYDNEIKLVEDKSTGKNIERVGLQKLLDTVTEGDTVAVTRIDRIARNTKDLLGIVEQLNEKGVSLVVLDFKGEKLDTSSYVGKFLVTMLGAVAEMELNMLAEKRMEGMKRAKEEGKHVGRKADLDLDNAAVQHAIREYKEDVIPVTMICDKYNIPRVKFYRLLKRHGITR